MIRVHPRLRRAIAKALRRPILTQRNALLAGIALAGASSAPLYLIAREVIVQRQAYARYSVERLHSEARTVFHGHQVTVSDRFTAAASGASPFVEGPVRITIDGVDHSHTAPLRIGTTYGDNGRYSSYLSVGEMVDRQEGSRELFVIQCLPIDTPKRYPRSISWRILFLSPRGDVRQEVFGFEDRGFPLYRTVLARTASPAGLGFHSQVLADWPNLFFPFLYPFASFALGGILLEVSGLFFFSGLEWKVV